MFPRALAISEVLWSNPTKRDTGDETKNRFDMLACKMR